MGQNLQHENQTGLATVAAWLTFPYTWLGLYVILAKLYGADFFGAGLGGNVVAGLLCLGLLNPFVPMALTNYLVRPLFMNLLGRELISGAGCLTGLVSFLAVGLSVVYFLARDLNLALQLMLLAPVAAGLLAVLVSFLSGKRLSLGLQRRQQTPGIRPDRTGQPGNLPAPAEPPPSLGRPPSRLPPPRRSDADRRQLPPRRRE